jgi:hypothetical protein
MGCARHDAERGADLTAEVGEKAIVVEPRLVDVGPIPVGAEKSFLAHVENPRASAIAISHVASSCGCTRVALAENELAAGAKTTLTGSVRAASQPGPFRHRIKLFVAKDPDAPVGELEIVGTTKSEIELLSPPDTLTPDAVGGKPAEASVVVVNRSDAAVDLKPPTDLPPELAVRVEPQRVPPNGRGQIVVRALPSALLDLDYELKIACSHPREQTLTIPLRIRPKGGIRVAPAAVRLGVVSREYLTRQTDIRITLSGSLLSRLAVTEVIPPDCLEIASKEIVGAEAVCLHCRFRPGYSGVDMSGDLRIVLTDASDRLMRLPIRIPVSGIVND